MLNWRWRRAHGGTSCACCCTVTALALCTLYLLPLIAELRVSESYISVPGGCFPRQTTLRPVDCPKCTPASPSPGAGSTASCPVPSDGTHCWACQFLLAARSATEGTPMLGWSDYVGSYFDQTAAGMACMSAAREVLAETAAGSASGTDVLPTGPGMPCWYLPMDMQSSDSRFHFRLAPPSTKASPAGAYLFGSVFLIMATVTVYCRCRFADPLELLDAFGTSPPPVAGRRNGNGPLPGTQTAAAPAAAAGRASGFGRSLSSSRSAGALLTSTPGPAAAFSSATNQDQGGASAVTLRRRSLAPDAAASASAAAAAAAGGGFSGPMPVDEGIELVVSPLVAAGQRIVTQGAGPAGSTGRGRQSMRPVGTT